MILYVYSKCSTCKNALDYLERRKIKFVRKEITETPPSVSELKKMLKFMNGSLKKLFNTSGMLYRELKLNEKLD
ncbi:MAG: ArsC/Spx/MgsR family protein, partial [Parachlamydiaceae bacterium]